jgi:hypothetical protein
MSITPAELNHKHRSAVRWLITYRKKVGLKEFQVFIRKEQTIKLWLKLKDDFEIQYRKGNKGDWNCWID